VHGRGVRQVIFGRIGFVVQAKMPRGSRDVEAGRMVAPIVGMSLSAFGHDGRDAVQRETEGNGWLVHKFTSSRLERKRLISRARFAAPLHGLRAKRETQKLYAGSRGFQPAAEPNLDSAGAMRTVQRRLAFVVWRREFGLLFLAK
jgi:hypothetical protein